MQSGEQKFSHHSEQSSPQGKAPQSGLALYTERFQMVPHLTHELLVDATFDRGRQTCESVRVDGGRERRESEKHKSACITANCNSSSLQHMVPVLSSLCTFWSHVQIWVHPCVLDAIHHLHLDIPAMLPTPLQPCSCRGLLSSSSKWSCPRTLSHLLHRGPVQSPRSTWNVLSLSTAVHTLFHCLFSNNILPQNPEVITPPPHSHGLFQMGTAKGG